MSEQPRSLTRAVHRAARIIERELLTEGAVFVLLVRQMQESQGTIYHSNMSAEDAVVIMANTARSLIENRTTLVDVPAIIPIALPKQIGTRRRTRASWGATKPDSTGEPE